MAGVLLNPTTVAVAPGSANVCSVTIRNSSSVVESFNVDVLGEAAAWATITPANLSLFPGADGVVTVTFSPPRQASVPAGTVDFGIRVAGTQDPADSVVEEGVLDVSPFFELSARMSPRTSESKRRARHVVTVENKGNAPLEVELTAVDPDELLAFDIAPRTITIEPGQPVDVAVKVAARKGFARGPAKHLPFQAVVRPVNDTTSAMPVTLEGAMSQRAGMPKFVPVLAAAAMIVVLAAIVLPGLTNKDGSSGTFSLTGNSGAAGGQVEGAAADAASEDGVAAEEGEAQADAEEAAEAAAEAASGDAPAAGGSSNDAGGGTTGAASSGAAAPSGGTAPSPGAASGGGGEPAAEGATGGDAPPQTAPPAEPSPAPSPSPSPAPAPAPAPAPSASRAERFVGAWVNGTSCLQISIAGKSMEVTTYSGARRGDTGFGSVADAENDDSFTATFPNSTKTTIALLDKSTIQVSSSSSTTFAPRPVTYSRSTRSAC